MNSHSNWYYTPTLRGLEQRRIAVELCLKERMHFPPLLKEHESLVTLLRICPIQAEPYADLSWLENDFQALSFCLANRGTWLSIEDMVGRLTNGGYFRHNSNVEQWSFADVVDYRLKHETLVQLGRQQRMQRVVGLSHWPTLRLVGQRSPA